MTAGLALDAKIYVAGHRGLAGSAFMRELRARGYANVVTRTHGELDLTDRAAVREFFQSERPEHVFMAAAKVGGIMANNTYPAEFIAENLAIQTNVIHEAWRAGVKRLLFLGSSCIYPRDCPQPIKESYLLTGPLEPTNRPYALAKIAGVEMCWAYNRQYGTRLLAAMPTNLYGPGDNYDLQNSHVLPALIRKFHEAKTRGDESVTLWGTGAPRREFLYSDDMAAASVFLMSLGEEAFDRVLHPDDEAFHRVLHPDDEAFDRVLHPDNEAFDRVLSPDDEAFDRVLHPDNEAFHRVLSTDDEPFDGVLSPDDEAVSRVLNPNGSNPQPPLINIGCGEDLTIRELAEKIRTAVGFTGRVDWDSTKPDGTPRKLLDVSRLFALGWRPQIGLDQGIAEAYRDFLTRHRE